MTLKPWREVAVPHPDVLEGTFQQSEFAADITAVRSGKASREYQDAAAFFRRTYITEGMRLLLVQVARRLNGDGGEPVVQLQTAFGGGKTHTMLAVYHMATWDGATSELAGVAQVLDQAGVMAGPRARVAVLDGTAHAPAQPWVRGKQTIRTLWGELAWQLGGQDAYEMVRAADESGTSPGKDVLTGLVSWCAPCVVLIDELVAYVRQFGDNQALSGGSYDSNLSFVQALTEAMKAVPNALVLASLPESEVEAGGARGTQTLRALEKTFGRVHALWKPVGTEESFEIVRRRLFEPPTDLTARDETCRALSNLYLNEGARLPSETQEARYFDRLVKAYPIHPEVFDRLYGDWSTLESFQRTRGVLKLMAHVVHELWKKGDRDLVILPSSLPLRPGKTRDELLSHLPQGWDPVLDRDVDAERAEAAELDRREPRFGAVQACLRVARAAFFGSAPSSARPGNTNRGLERARILLACLQPGHSSALYGDALSRLADRLHYLSASGDKTSDTTRFWFDTRANLRREMEDLKARLDERGEVRPRIAEILGRLTAGRGLFDAAHVFTPHGDVPDTEQLRLVVLDLDCSYSKQTPAPATDAVKLYARSNGTRPRLRSNRLVFLVADTGSVGRVRDMTRVALAWEGIVKAIKGGQLNVDLHQVGQADRELSTARAVAERAIRDCYRWVLCPVKHQPTDTDKDEAVEAYALNAAAPQLVTELDRVCEENELVIRAWSPVHLRTRLRELYWKDGRASVRALTVWDDLQRHTYFPRLRGRAVFEQAVMQGAASADFFGLAYGQGGDTFEGFRLGGGAIQVDDTLLLVEPEVARAYAARMETAKAIEPRPVAAPETGSAGGGFTRPSPLREEAAAGAPVASSGAAKRPTSFVGAVEVNALTAKMNLVTVAEELINLLTSDPNGAVSVTVEIRGEFPAGVSEQLRRAVSENAGQLKFKTAEWG